MNEKEKAASPLANGNINRDSQCKVNQIFGIALNRNTGYLSIVSISNIHESFPYGLHVLPFYGTYDRIIGLYRWLSADYRRIERYIIL